MAKKTEQKTIATPIVSASKVTDLSQIRLGLTRMYRLMELLGHPQNKVPIVHIAGTNGKGSTLMFLQSICQKAGIKTGTFSSPAVFDPMEILTLDEKNITKEALDEVTKTVETACEHMSPKDQPSAFEKLTAGAFVYFAKTKPDLILLETGLGGDEDATNCYDEQSQVLSIITPIGYDHCSFLGSTLQEIATHKAGIYRKKKPVVLGLQQEEAKKTLITLADALSCPVYETKKEQIVVHTHDPLSMSYQSMKNVTLRVRGSIQTENAACAITAARVLQQSGYAITDDDIRRGLEEMFMPGRMETFEIANEKTTGVFLMDGAHNPPAAMRLREYIDTVYPDYDLCYITGVYEDKEYKTVMETMLFNVEDRLKKIYTISPEGKRALDAKKLREQMLVQLPKLKQTQVTALKDRSDAIQKAMAWLRRQKKKSIIVCFGSLSFLSELRAQIMTIMDKPCKDNETQGRMKTMDKKKIEEGVRLILEGIGEDVTREGLIETPDRIARMYEEILSGYSQDPKVPLSKQFRACGTDIILEKDIQFYSLCEHHMVPFYGKAHVAYLPTDKVVGLSKLARVVEIFAKRLQLQERMTAQIADAMMEELKTLGVMVVIEAEHMCMTMRGVKKPGSKTMTYVTRGEFAKNDALTDRVLAMISDR